MNDSELIPQRNGNVICRYCQWSGPPGEHVPRADCLGHLRRQWPTPDFLPATHSTVNPCTACGVPARYHEGNLYPYSTHEKCVRSSQKYAEQLRAIREAQQQGVLAGIDQ